MLGIILGIVTVGLGVKGFTAAGIPLTRRATIQGRNAKILGVVCFLLGTLFLVDGVVATLGFGQIWGRVFGRFELWRPSTVFSSSELKVREEQSRATNLEFKLSQLPWEQVEIGKSGYIALLPANLVERSEPSRESDGSNGPLRYRARFETTSFEILVVNLDAPTNGRELQSKFAAERRAVLESNGWKYHWTRHRDIVGLSAEEIILHNPEMTHDEVIFVDGRQRVQIIVEYPAYCAWIERFFLSFERVPK